MRMKGHILNVMSKLDRRDLRLIYFTHAHLDLYGSAAAIRRLTSAAIAVHHAGGQAMAGGETRGGFLQLYCPWLGHHDRPAACSAFVRRGLGTDRHQLALAASGRSRVSLSWARPPITFK